MAPVLQLKDVSYIYGENTPFRTVALDHVTVEIEQGELLGIIGHTGSGKSTLIQHFNGILEPASGQVLLNGTDIWADRKNIRKVRFAVGLCFQYPEYQLFEETVYKDIAFGPKNMGLDEAEVDRRVRRAAEFVGLQEKHLESSPFDLSGGEKRRAAIAGVMAMEPQVLIMDEPTAGLDPRGRDMVLELVRTYRETTGSTVVLVSHSMEDVAKIATKVMVVNESKIAMHGAVNEVYARAQELVAMGLNVPQITRVFAGLRARGLNVPEDVFTVAQGKAALLELYRTGGRI